MVTMETVTARQIKIVDSPAKRWSQPSCIITPEDLAEAETEHDGCALQHPEQKMMLEKHMEIVKRTHPGMRDIVIHSELPDRTQPQTFKTPQKLVDHSNKFVNHSNISPISSLSHMSPSVSNSSSSISNMSPGISNISSNISNMCSSISNIPSTFSNMSPNVRPANLRHSNSVPVLGDNSDWMLAERSTSRSPPSPAVMSRSPEGKCQRSPRVHHVSPAVHSNCNTVFNFSPERTERYRTELESDSGRVKKRLFDGPSQGPDLEASRDASSPGFMTSLPSPSYRRREPYLPPHFPRDVSRDRTSRDVLEPEVPYYLDSPSSRPKMADYFASRENMFRAKRRLDVDDEYVSTPKRLKSDFEREMGYRYLQQLESDIASLRDKLTNQEQEPQKTAHCTCAIMERQFLQMAESAYRSVRRIDASPQGFEQFRRELIQTNEVMKDSMDVLKNIRTFCEHKS